MKSIRKVLMVIMAICTMGMILAGCSNKEVIVAKINGKSVSKQLYGINLWSTQRGLEAVQANYWNFESIYGQSPEEYAKTKTLRAVTYCIVAQQKAEELDIDIKLTKDEKAKVKEAAENAMKVDENFIKNYQITQKHYEEYYTFAVQNKKVLESLSESYEPNDEEVNAKVMSMEEKHETADHGQIERILFTTKNELGEDIPEDKKQEVYDKARKALEDAVNGTALSEVNDNYLGDVINKDSYGKYNVTRDSSSDAVMAQVVFEKGEVGKVYPELVETELGYEIVKILEVNYEAKESIRERAIKIIKEEYAKNELEEMTDFAEIQKTEAYDDIHIGPLVSANEQDKSGETSESTKSEMNDGTQAAQ